MSHFYLTLPSNASLNIYPGNTVAKYTTRLQKRIELDGDWEVGLTEMVYPYNLVNVSGEWFQIYFDGTTMEKVMLQDGYYPTVQSLIGKLRDAIQEEAWRVGIVRTDMESLLNFDGWSKDDPGPYVTTSLPPLWFTNDYDSVLQNASVDSLFVYCDVLEYVPVGDTLAPLLRTVVVRGKHGDQISEKYINPMYLPVQKKSFDSIEINIMTDTGDAVPFVDGPSTVTLHFRRASDTYLL